MKVTLREKKLKNRYSLYLDIYVDGKREYEVLKLYPSLKPKNSEEREYNANLRRKAEIIRARRQMELIDNKHRLAPKASKILFMDYFFELTQERKKSKGNYGNWDSVYKILKEYFGGKSVTISELTDEDIADIKNYILNVYKTKSNRKLSRNAAVSYFNKVKAALNQAFDDKLIDIKIGSRIKAIKAEETHREFLSQEEVNEILKHECDFPVMKSAFMFSIFTGLRWSDINNLRWENIKYSEGTGYIVKYIQQKTGNVDNLPIPATAITFLGERQAANERVFKGLKYSAWHNLKLSQWMMKAGITRKITFHSARHTYATLLMTNNVGAEVIQKMLGHKELKTTMVYAKVIDQRRIDAVKFFDDMTVKLENSK